MDEQDGQQKPIYKHSKNQRGYGGTSIGLGRFL